MRLKIIIETNTLFSITSAQSAYLVNKEFPIYKKNYIYSRTHNMFFGQAHSTHAHKYVGI